jgi:Bacterial protein of unknown function (DUF924)
VSPDDAHGFGRFPHRNAVLGRDSTAEEADWLTNGGERFDRGRAEKHGGDQERV